VIVAIASGKGGTGKTTVALNLARSVEGEVLLLDCDVEEPNAHLFLKGFDCGSETACILIPEVDASLCDGCGECARFCQHHAIVCFGERPLVFPEMCHGCGGCALVCPARAIGERQRRMGLIESVRSGNVTLVQGRLDVGMPATTALIRAVKARLAGNEIPAILDAPPGTSCPVVATLCGADLAVLVTEPTPFGLHDLCLAVETVREIGVPFGVVVNRMGMGDGRVHAFCNSEGIQVLAEIPDDRRIAEAYSRGEVLLDALPEYSGLFSRLWEKILSLARRSEPFRGHERTDRA